MTKARSLISASRIFIPVVLLLGGILVFVSLSMTDINLKDSFMSNDNKGSQKAENMKRDTQVMEPNFWKNINLKEPEIPQSVKDKVKSVKIESKHATVMDMDTFYREAIPPEGVAPSGQTVLLLHGAAFKSQTWLDLGTISLLAAMGHHVVALDLPGYGETRSTLSGDKGSYMKDIISTLKLSNIVIVSPSMSGGFTIPFLISNANDIAGFIPVAPVGTNLVRNKAATINTPTLIIYGEKDTGLGYGSRDDLINLPNSQIVELPKARHPAYLDQPDLFHTLLYNFMNQLKKRNQ